MHLDDARAVARAKQGDQSAFRELVERHGRAVYRIAYRIAGRHEDAEEVVQETFIRAYRQLDRFEARASFSTWLYRIGFNCAIDYVRAHRQRESPETPETLERMAADAEARSPDDGVYAGQITSRVRDVLGALTPQERTAFVMRHLHGCSIDEIAHALAVSDSAAKHAVFRAVKKMRAALKTFLHVKARVTI
jgi:RNA polymerase sigma-70 factor (ECF subfamily)